MAMHLSSALGDEGAWRGIACPIDNAASVIGSRPTLLIVREAFYGTTRFDEFVQHTRLTTAVVSSRLKTLVESLVLETRPYRDVGKRTRNEYVLTEKGNALLPLVLALMQWGSDHVLEGGLVRANDIVTGSRLSVGPKDVDGAMITPDRVIIAPIATE